MDIPLYNYNWLVVSNIFFFSIPIDELHHFSRWFKLTTNQMLQFSFFLGDITISQDVAGYFPLQNSQNLVACYGHIGKDEMLVFPHPFSS